MTILNVSTFKIEEFSWDQIQSEVFKVNPELAAICNQLNLTPEHTLFKLCYPYGATIVDKGKFHIANANNVLVPIDDTSVPSYLQEKLNYCPIPLSLVLQNTNEVFFEVQGNVIPLNLLKVGELFGLFEVMNMKYDDKTKPVWSVSAGGLSVFMLPEISDIEGHNRIKKEFGINIDPPRKWLDQWKVFSSIYKNASVADKWSNTIVVFANKWFDKNNYKDSSWLKFYEYLSEAYLPQLQMHGDLTKSESLWLSFDQEINKKKIKPKPYIIDTLKYLVSIADDTSVAFKPATDEEMLPVNFLQDVYINCYQLKDYIPTIMQPTKIKGNDLVYYSLSYPMITSIPKDNNLNIIEDEREIKLLMNMLLSITKEKFLKRVEYNFCDNDVNSRQEISDIILKHDNRFSYCGAKNNLKNKLFCADAPFFKGCISIGKKL
ncbi:MAG: hypothetical protein RCG15_00490 [Candidatus Rickettsia vulgarisii]